ncbi:TPA: GntR family transcriptional regulator [Kluyvera cryocrescens]|uniref:GntR family transcriptional regulator n=1 Tax=Kluyvera cryocrescens TaxID=580 RepID=A0AAW9CAK2_KLUCR|nr:GntR family transcriptional regulator [Kluyvera cryocrescens]MCX2867974.1 GntR family transcriptional regulator [Kluyvera cryocrescens]MDU5686434.1 GntR family transcriptional regulator [Kluyvera cryocrescens]MDW3778898.1 GntR family transcriptional regulator [Kluyvera cryocrescens]MEB6633411.1 GntR family transcriptional regulator [Kluyvera cryocrescens]MEB7558145.1 GntR family transcriptional regulator [Kluyvera cryocrescens]
MVYQNVINLLKNRLNSAIYNIGDLLPSEKELAELYDVSRNTLRKALKTLEEEGMIERRHGSGTYLRNKHFQASVTHLDSFTEIAKNEGKTPTSQILKFELQTASDEIANSLRVTLGEPVYYAKRLRLIDNIAMQVEETWLSASRFPDLTIAHMKKSKFSYIENECGVKIMGCYESIQPILPSPEVAKLLHISALDPIIRMQTQAVDEQSTPIDYSILYTNMYEFQVKYFLPRKAATGPTVRRAGA